LNLLEKQLENITKIVNEKDSVILIMKKHVEEIEINVEKQQEETNNVKKKKEIIKCEYCDFIANSKQGLKIHKKRKHTCQIESKPE
jgi:hypothetical protein